MDSIKIVDKLTLRQEALRMALQTVYGVNVSENLKDLVIKRAVDIAEYIQGSADLPEYVDPQSEHKYFADLIAKMQENFKSNPIPMWISVDSEMKPPKGAEVLCALRYTSNIEYVVMSYNPEEKLWYGGNDDDNTNHVVAWMPIPTFVEPLKL